MAEVTVEAVVGVLPDAAGVQDDDIGRLHVLRALVALRLEQARHPLRIVLVHLAPEGADEVPAGHRPQVRGWPPGIERVGLRW
jgi:hypothetical protein